MTHRSVAWEVFMEDFFRELDGAPPRIGPELIFGKDGPKYVDREWKMDADDAARIMVDFFSAIPSERYRFY